MKFNIKSMDLQLRQATEHLPFAEITYYWGKMGAGKTSIAKMIDYCLGGNVELSPAMQSEFVSARLNLSLLAGTVIIERERDSDNVLAQWGSGDQAYQLILPARRPNGVVLPGTEVETLSDLIFHLSGLRPPRVRKSKRQADSDLSRLSVRDLLWYCYLDQDEIDSSFFHLQKGGDTFKQLKSRDVLRYVIGFHDERVAEIEADLDRVKGERLGIYATMESLKSALKQAGVETALQVSARREELLGRVKAISEAIEVLRRPNGREQTTSHAADELRNRAIELSDRLSTLAIAETDLLQQIDESRRHLNELQTLSVRFKRSSSARAVLSGVTFKACPRCAQVLPSRDSYLCQVCCQPDELEPVSGAEEQLIEKDVRARSAELNDIIAKHTSALEELKAEQKSVTDVKKRVEWERNDALYNYDSAYLSNAIALERERAAIFQEIEGLAAIEKFSILLLNQEHLLADALSRESLLKLSWKDAKAAAEEDDTNLQLLKEYFLASLLRAKVPGISPRDEVEIPKTDFFPVIRGNDIENETETSFTTLSSGGKKTLFKCCFAIALHRLAVHLGAPLPELLIMDSPMKNISERENREQFRSFYDMVYDLNDGELKQTQIILIDKEFATPTHKATDNVLSRHMTPNDPKNPPLIKYYRGN